MSEEKKTYKQIVDEANTAPLTQYEPGLYYDFSNYTPIYPMEFWKPVTELSVPNVRPGYWISNMGRVYDSVTNRILHQQLTGKAYLSIAFETNVRTHVRKMIHRVAMIEFFGFDPNPERDIVDHISAFKRNNSEYNLRWATNVENIRYAVEYGLVRDNYMTCLTDEMVHEICQMMEDGRPRFDIYEYMRSCGVPYPGSLFDAIYNKKSWMHISNRYNFADYRMRESNFDNSQIHYICQQLEANPDIPFAEILAGLGIDMYDVDDRTRRKLSTALSHIKNGREHTDISSQYNIKPAPRNYILTEEQVHYACKRMEEGADNKTILLEMGLITEDMKQREKVSQYGVMNKIRYRQCYYDIAKQYKIPFKK